MGHNIYILCHQLAQHNKELAGLLKPNCGGVEEGQAATGGNQQQQQQQQLLQMQQNQVDPRVNRALVYYASHTAQIEVGATHLCYFLLICCYEKCTMNENLIVHNVLFDC